MIEYSLIVPVVQIPVANEEAVKARMVKGFFCL
jgi:hypothetical protein